MLRLCQGHITEKTEKEKATSGIQTRVLSICCSTVLAMTSVQGLLSIHDTP